MDDLASFFKKIAPVLERRLEGSVMHRFSGELKIGFYDFNGITLTFENGKLTDVVQGELEQVDVAFPYLTFLNVLFGHRTRQELGHILPETGTGRKAGLLIDVLFPIKDSWLMALA